MLVIYESNAKSLKILTYASSHLEMNGSEDNSLCIGLAHVIKYAHCFCMLVQFDINQNITG